MGELPAHAVDPACCAEVVVHGDEERLVEVCRVGLLLFASGFAVCLTWRQRLSFVMSARGILLQHMAFCYCGSGGKPLMFKILCHLIISFTLTTKILSS